MKRTSAALAALGLTFGCSGDARDDDTTPVTPPSLVVVDDTAPATASFSISAAIPAAGTIDTLGVTQDGHPIVVAQDRVYELVAGALEWRPLYSEDGTTLDDVTAVAPRHEGGAWIAASGKLFVLDDLYVLATPLALDAGAIHAIHDVAEGPLAGLWLATDSGLFRRTDRALETWTIPDVQSTVTDLAIDPTGYFGLAIADGTFVTLEADGTAVVTDRDAVDLGEVKGVAASMGAVWAAGTKGVLRFALFETKPYRHYLLGSGGNLLAVATDPVTGTPWFRSATQLFEIDGPTINAYPMASSNVPRIVVDTLGHVFVANGETLMRNGDMPSESATSFERDVLPWIQTNCAQCHGNQTQDFEDYAVFAPIAEEALSRVRRGDMPRCTGGVLCSPEQRLTAEQFAVLEQWLRDGKAE